MGFHWLEIDLPLAWPSPQDARHHLAGLGEEEKRVNKWVLPLCWAAVLLDGFDLVVLGTVIPVLLQEKLLTTASASAVSTAGLVGMMLGALIIGTITDVIGRRKVMIYAVAGFSVFTLACAFAQDATTFGVLRFLAGLGLGGCLPTAIALVNEARPQRGGRATTLIMTGYHVGAVITALLGIVLIPELGWRALFVAGALPALVLVPFITPYADGQSLRARLQAVLGRQLRGYSLAFDVPRHTAKGTLYIHRRDLESAKRCLAHGLPQLEMGCVASASCVGALSCH